MYNVHPLPGDVMLTSLKSCRSPCMWHSHHAAERDAKSLSLQRWPSNSPDLNLVDYSIRRILQERVYRSQIHDVKELKTWKNVCWASGGWWTTPSLWQRLRSGVVVWMYVGLFAWIVDILNINFEPLTSCCVSFVSSILVPLNVIDINMYVLSANIVWNVLLLCLRLSHGMVAT